MDTKTLYQIEDQKQEAVESWNAIHDVLDGQMGASSILPDVDYLMKTIEAWYRLMTGNRNE